MPRHAGPRRGFGAAVVILKWERQGTWNLPGEGRRRSRTFKVAEAALGVKALESCCSGGALEDGGADGFDAVFVEAFQQEDRRRPALRGFRL